MKRGLLFTISALLLALAVAWPVQTLALRPPAVTGTPLYLPLVLKQATFTPLPTATPTRTPTPTATTLPPGVSVLDSHSYFIDSINYLHIVGEVFNNTTDHLRFVKITANLFNGAQLVATDFTFTHLDHLPAGEKTCFSVSLEQPANWTAYQFESPTYLTMGEPLPNLPLLNVSSSIDPTFGWHEIIGQVRNDHGVTVNYVQPVGTLYNAQGVVIDCDFTFVSSTHLTPNQTSAFEMTSIGRSSYTDVTSYRLQVDGDPQ